MVVCLYNNSGSYDPNISRWFNLWTVHLGKSAHKCHDAYCTISYTCYWFVLLEYINANCAGVDDAFLLVHAWQLAPSNDKSCTTRHARLGAAMAEIGPSILITSVTNTVAFTIGAVASPPEIRLFCATVALAMSISFLFQLFLFSPIMALSWQAGRLPMADGSVVSKMNDKAEFIVTRGDQTVTTSTAPETVAVRPMFTRWRPCKKGMFDGLVWYSKFVTSTSGRVLAIVIFAGYLALSITGVTMMEAEMNPEDLMPADSSLIEMFKIRHAYLWREYHPISVMINRRINFSDPTEYETVLSLVSDMESLPDSLGSWSTQLWLREYKPWKVSEDEWATADNETVETSSNDTVLLDKLEQFLEEKQYEHWKSMIMYTKNG